jgi:hypothetical protein
MLKQDLLHVGYVLGCCNEFRLTSTDLDIIRCSLVSFDRTSYIVHSLGPWIKDKRNAKVATQHTRPCRLCVRVRQGSSVVQSDRFRLREDVGCGAWCCSVDGSCLPPLCPRPLLGPSSSKASLVLDTSDDKKAPHTHLMSIL